MGQSSSRHFQNNSPRVAGILTRNHRFFAVLAVLCVVQILELLILQRKYDIFTGGFLQMHSYRSISDRTYFLGLSIWVDLFFLSLLAGLWFSITDRFGKNRISSSYHFFFLLSFFVTLILFVKYKVLAYFNDTLNFIVIKKLGGGSLFDSMIYVVDEVIVLIAVLVGALVVYVVGRKAVTILVLNLDPPQTKNLSVTRFLLFFIPSTVLTIALVLFANNDANLRYGMRKKLSFFAVTKIFDYLTDFDRDGYGLFFYPTDPKPLQNHIYPGAVDIPNNGTDEDGFVGDFVSVQSANDVFSDLRPKPGKHIILIVLESTRHDIVGKKINGHYVVPNITGLAQRYTNIDYAYSHTGYTASSLLAIFNRTLLIRDDKTTLLDFLKTSGYQLSFFSGQDESFGNVAKAIGMDNPGNHFFDAASALEDRLFASKQSGSLRLSEARVVEAFRRQIGRIDWQQPQFVYFNLQAAHFPYSHPQMPKLITDSLIPRSAISVNNRSWLQLTYLNALAVADQAIGEIIRLLNEAMVYENTVLVITGDHGESLFDDGFLGHGHSLNAAQTRIPLIFNVHHLDFTEPVGQIDMAEIIVRTATAQPKTKSQPIENKAVFQFIGTYRKPTQIGIVERGEKRTILDLRSRELFFSDLGKWQSFDTIMENDDEFSRRASRLLNIWENLRWKDYKIRHR